MVLVDTSVWIDHLRKAHTGLNQLLEANQVVTHPFVIGELACGSLGDRRAFLYNLGKLPHVHTASDGEVLTLIDRLNLMGKGVGYLDMHLLASIRLAPEVRLWTRDKKLASLADQLSIVH